MTEPRSLTALWKIWQNIHNSVCSIEVHFWVKKRTGQLEMRCEGVNENGIRYISGAWKPSLPCAVASLHQYLIRWHGQPSACRRRKP